MYSLKRPLLRLIERFGYVVLKNSDYQRLLGTPQAGSSGALNIARIAQSRPPPRGAESLPRPVLRALSSACSDLRRSRVEGDIVDCGDGSPANLTAIASALAGVGDTARRLILLDVSVDPAHRAKAELGLWGADVEPMAFRRRGSPRAGCPLPPELAGLPYPSDKIAVLRYPKLPVEISGPIALLSLTAENYPANRLWIRRLLPLVADGGFVAVAEAAPRPGGRDAVEQAVAELGIALSFHTVTGTYRLGTKAMQ